MTHDAAPAVGDVTATGGVGESAAATAGVSIIGVTKTFPGVRALSNADFDCRPGEVHALVGENGSGKSTMIKIASGVYEPDEGTVAAVPDGPVRFERSLPLSKAMGPEVLVATTISGEPLPSALGGPVTIAHQSVGMIFPFTIVWPTGTCIQLLLARIQNEENMVPSETMQQAKK